MDILLLIIAIEIKGPQKQVELYPAHEHATVVMDVKFLINFC